VTESQRLESAFEDFQSSELLRTPLDELVLTSKQLGLAPEHGDHLHSALGTRLTTAASAIRSASLVARLSQSSSQPATEHFHQKRDRGPDADRSPRRQRAADDSRLVAGSGTSERRHRRRRVLTPSRRSPSSRALGKCCCGHGFSVRVCHRCSRVESADTRRAQVWTLPSTWAVRWPRRTCSLSPPRRSTSAWRCTGKESCRAASRRISSPRMER
jgi:hypothetical protein